MYNPAIFKNRKEAGQKLGLKLDRLGFENPIVLAIPSGGVPVGQEVAKILKSPFGLIIARKIQYPWTTEAGFGAVTPDGTSYLSPEAEKLPQEVVRTQTEKAIREIKHREKEFLKGRRRIPIKEKTVILVDDGLATGSTMFAAIKSIRKKNPALIIVATPTASEGAVELLGKEADQLITLYQHPKNLPFAVASSYQEWHDLTDEEVKKYLKNGYN